MTTIAAALAELEAAVTPIEEVPDTPARSMAEMLAVTCAIAITRNEYPEDMIPLVVQLTRERIALVLEHPEMLDRTVPLPRGGWHYDMEQVTAMRQWLDQQQGLEDDAEAWQ